MGVVPAETERMKLADLNPAAYNPKVDLQPADAEYQQIKESLLTFGQVEPLVWNRRTGNLVGGHQRRRVMMDLGETAADVSVVDLDEAQEKQLNLALNRIKGRWSEDKLAELLGSMQKQAVPLSVTGFRPDELTAALQRFERLHAGDFLAQLTQPVAPFNGAAAAVFQQQAQGGLPPMGAPAGGYGRGDEDEDEDAEEPDYPPLPQTPQYGANAYQTGATGSDGANGYQPTMPLPAGAGAPPEQVEQYVQLTYSMTVPQREIVLAALKGIRAQYGLSTSIEALVWLANDYLTRAGQGA